MTGRYQHRRSHLPFHSQLDNSREQFLGRAAIGRDNIKVGCAWFEELDACMELFLANGTYRRSAYRKAAKRVYLGTSDDEPGLVAQRQTDAETIGIARDVAKKLMDAQGGDGNKITFATESGCAMIRP